MAKLCGVCVRTLQRHFRKHNLCLGGWLRQLRLTQAYERLASGERVKQVAYDLGYSELSNFSRAFKAAHGIPPRLVSTNAALSKKKLPISSAARRASKHSGTPPVEDLSQGVPDPQKSVESIANPPAGRIAPILLVDDLEEDLILAQRVLRQCKILNPLLSFKNGKEIVEYFQSTGGERAVPCILFLDLVMSPLSGLEVLRALRQNPNLKKSLIVMLSGLTDIKAVHDGYQLGAHTFLIKPVTPADILELIAAMPKHIRAEQVPKGCIIHLVPDSATSFVKKENTGEGASSPPRRIHGEIAPRRN